MSPVRENGEKAEITAGTKARINYDQVCSIWSWDPTINIKTSALGSHVEDFDNRIYH